MRLPRAGLRHGCASGFSRIPATFYFGALSLRDGPGARCSLVAAAIRVAARNRRWLAGHRAFCWQLLPAADAAVAIVHQLVDARRAAGSAPATRLPASQYPSHDRTAVVVPLLLGSVDGVAQALEHIEVQYLANRDPQMRFALLSDFLDSPTETCRATTRSSRLPSTEFVR